MLELWKTGAYFIGGRDLVPADEAAPSHIKAKYQLEVSQGEAKQNTIAYSILQNHNTSGSAR